MKCGLLGKKLGHSYSPQIHGYLGDYPYDLYEKTPEELPEFDLEHILTNVNTPEEFAAIADAAQT